KVLFGSMNTDFKTTNVILKLLSFQQNDNELTVPRLSKLNLDWSLSSLKPNLIPLSVKKRNIELDYHQRVPTQIDRSILLKSFPVELCSNRTAILAS
ncbi:hypothetical protein LCL85_21055, partial [Vibrio alginolyticus]|nr:hypothetical protein [Vibrio alginolyticus]